MLVNELFGEELKDEARRLATFPTAAMGVSAALKMRSAMDRLNESRKHEDLLVKIGMPHW